MKTKLFIVVLVGLFMIIGTMLLNAEEMYDFEGETVTMVTWTEHFHEDYHPERIERKEMAEEKFNVKIENLVIPYGEATETQISRLLAGDSEYDIWQMHSFKHYWIHVGEGHLYPISDVLPDSHYDDMLTGVLDYQGHKYHFNDPNPGWQAPVVVFWNKDLFEREGLPNLYEVYENGNWTWEKATEIGKLLTDDTNGDGEIDRWGIGGLLHDWTAFPYTNDATQVRYKDGRMDIKVEEEAYVDSLQLLVDWVHEDNISTTWDNVGEFTSGKMGMFVNRVGDTVWPIVREQQPMKDDFGIVPLPKGPEMDEHVFPAYVSGVYGMPINVKKPEALVALYEYVFDWRTEEESQEQLKDSIADLVRDQKSYEILFDVANNFKPEWWIRFGLGEVLGNLRQTGWGVITNADSPATALSEIAPELQANLDDLLDQ